MSVVLPNVGGTLTGGTESTLSFTGSANGTKVSFATADSTRLAPRHVDFYSNPARTTSQDPGVARSGLKVTFSDRQQSEGCCTVSAGSVIIDVGLRWSLSQPEALVDSAIELLQSLVFSDEFISSIKSGSLPS